MYYLIRKGNQIPISSDYSCVKQESRRDERDPEPKTKTGESYTPDWNRLSTDRIYTVQ